MLRSPSHGEAVVGAPVSSPTKASPAFIINSSDMSGGARQIIIAPAMQPPSPAFESFQLRAQSPMSRDKTSLLHPTPIPNPQSL